MNTEKIHLPFSENYGYIVYYYLHWLESGVTGYISPYFLKRLSERLRKCISASIYVFEPFVTTPRLFTRCEISHHGWSKLHFDDWSRGLVMATRVVPNKQLLQFYYSKFTTVNSTKNCSVLEPNTTVYCQPTARKQPWHSYKLASKHTSRTQEMSSNKHQGHALSCYR